MPGPQGGMPTVAPRQIGVVLAVAGLIAACAGTPPSGAAGTSVSAGADSPRLAADALKFDRSQLQLPANRPFALVLDNKEAVAHNVSIHASDGSSLFTGEVFTGPQVRVYAVPALAPGSYEFRCDVHPDMKGTATVQ